MKFLNDIVLTGAGADLTAPATVTFSGLSATTETNAVVVNSSGVLSKRTLGSNAFNSTTIPTNAVLTTGNQTIAGVKTFSNNLTVGGNSLTAGSLDINGNADISGDLVITGNIKNNVENGTLDFYGGTDTTNDAHIRLHGNNTQWGSLYMDFGYNAANSKFIVNQGGTERFKIQNNVAYFSGKIQGAGEIEGTSLDINGNGDVSGTLNVNGSLTTTGAAVNGNLYANRYLQNATGIPTNNLGSPTVTEMALFENQFKPQTTLANSYDDLADLTFFTRASGTTEGDYTEVTSYSDDQKRKFLRTHNSGVYIPNTHNSFRVEFTGYGYTFANAMVAYWSSDSHNTQVHVWKRRCSDNAWIQHTSSSTTVSSWPGHLYLPFSTIAWHETSTTSTGHYNKIRIEFTPNWIPYSGSGTDYSTRSIKLYGMQIWGGYPSGKRTVHNYDQNGKLDLFKDLGLKDNGKATFGHGDDLQIYHDGSNSFIKDTGTGDLYIDAATNFFVRNQANGEVWVKGTDSGVSLRYQDNQKLITTNTGIDITGNITLSGTVDGIDIATDVAANTAKTSNIVQTTITGNAGTATALTSGNKSIAGSLTITHSGDGILNLRQSDAGSTSGTAEGGWNYIQFQDGQGDRQAYFGIDSSGHLLFNPEVSGALVKTSTGFYVGGNITLSGTVDGIDIASRDAVLTSTTTTAGAALPKAGGIMTGKITLDGAPSSNLHAATKAYVDGAVIANTDTQDLSISGRVISLTDGGSVTVPETTIPTIPSGNQIIDWTSDQGSTNIHAGNYTDTDTVYTHPTTAGNKHIPTGGASGQFLKYTSSGTAVWATPSYIANTDTQNSAATTRGFFSGSGINTSTGVITNTTYTKAGSEALGLVMIGEGIDIDSEGTISTSARAAATTSAGGDMSASDKTKLDGIQTGADRTGTVNVTNAGASMKTSTETISGTKTFSALTTISNTTDSSSAAGTNGALRTAGGASVAKKLYVGSTITGSADVIAYSDKRLKKNVKTLDGKKVLEMRGVSFERTDSGKQSSGVIAQEMEKVAPELVIDDGNYKGVAYGNVVGYLIEAIKDQQKQIDELKAVIDGNSK